MKLYGNQEDDVKAFAGSLYGMNPKTIVTYPAGADVDFGKALFIDDGVVSNSGDKENYVGVAVFHQCEGGKYFKKDAVASMKDGFIWVVLDSSIEPEISDKAYVIPGSGKFTNVAGENLEVGTFESVADNGLALVCLK